MHTGDKTGCHHKYCKDNRDGGKEPAELCISDTIIELNNSCRHNAHDKHGCRRWIGGFQRSFNEDGAEIDREDFKEDKCRHHDYIEYAESNYVAVDFDKAFAAYPLNKPKYAKAKAEGERDYA